MVSRKNVLQAHESLAAIPENRLVKLLVDDSYWSSWVTRIKGIPSKSDVLTELPLRNLTGSRRQGDVDILIAKRDHPEFSTAIEVKRVKVGQTAFEKKVPNKLKELRKGIRQANNLAKVGFSQVYFFVFVVVDCRGQDVSQNRFNGISQELDSKIQPVITLDGLDQRIGLLRYDFVQLKDGVSSPGDRASANLLRSATCVTQPADVTKWVAWNISSSNKTPGADSSFE